MRTARVVLHAALWTVAIASSSRGTRADPLALDPAAAEAAFAEARALIQNGRFAEACPKLEASYALDPALGTLLNLGDCFEHVGRTASAWLRYRDAAAMALQQNHREREAIARARVAALESGLCRLVVRAPDRPQIKVLRDGLPVAREAIGLPVPVDPGAHLVEAESSGTSFFSARIDVGARAGEAACPLTTVAIPAPDDERVPLRGQGAVNAASDAVPAASPPPQSPRWETVHTLAVAAAAGGVVAAGIGTFFAVDAANTKSEGDAKCTTVGCSSEGKAMLADAGRSADIATVSVVVGAALFATGVVLWLTSPPLRRAAAAGPARAFVAGDVAAVRF